MPGAANTVNLGVFCNSTDVGTISKVMCRRGIEGTILWAGWTGLRVHTHQGERADVPRREVRNGDGSK